MGGFSALIGIIAAILVYRHASGKATYNKVVVLLLCLVSLVLTVPALIIGWHNNPRRKAGANWKTVI